MISRRFYCLFGKHRWKFFREDLWVVQVFKCEDCGRKVNRIKDGI
jgi:hypothetical protein